jgi:hypothetical protein
VGPSQAPKWVIILAFSRFGEQHCLAASLANNDNTSYLGISI